MGDDVDSVTLHWPTEEGGHLKFRKRESRCVLISSGLGPRARMYAHLRPCDSKQASGLLTVAAAAAPPPPPGVTVAHYYDPLRAPPPPPSIKRAAFEVYVRREIRPRTLAICKGGLEGIQHQHICLAVAKTLSGFQPITGAGIVSPFCERICWHSCDGESHGDGNVTIENQTNPRDPQNLLRPTQKPTNPPTLGHPPKNPQIPPTLGQPP